MPCGGGAVKRRTKASGKSRPRKTGVVRRRNPPKSVRGRRPSASGQEAKIAFARERDEALEQQAATSEVLQLISSSKGDLEPVFAAILESAVRICSASFGDIGLWEDGTARLVAIHKMTPPAF